PNTTRPKTYCTLKCEKRSKNHQYLPKEPKSVAIQPSTPATSSSPSTRIPKGLRLAAFTSSSVDSINCQPCDIVLPLHFRQADKAIISPCPAISNLANVAPVYANINSRTSHTRRTSEKMAP